MKRFCILGIFLLSISSVFAQYNKEKLTSLLTANPWSVTSAHVARPERKMTFNKDQSVQVEKANDKGGTVSLKDKWSVSSTDNIRWFLTVGPDQYEMIVSYTKSGSQFIKLTHQAGADKITGYYEMSLNAIK